MVPVHEQASLSAFRPGPYAPDPLLIAFTGRAGAGKSTAAQYLIEHKNFVRLRFAGPLKAMLRALGLTDREIDGDLKEQPCDTLCGRTPRRAMQTLGTEWGRELIAPDLWVSLFARDAELHRLAGVSVVCDDLRFPNEAATIRKLGGKIIGVASNDAPEVQAHVSEQHAITADRWVYNSKVGFSLFHASLEQVLSNL